VQNQSDLSGRHCLFGRIVTKGTHELEISNPIRQGDDKTDETFRASLIVFSMHDLDGQKVFDVADIPAVAAKSFAVQDRLYEIAAKVNGIGMKAEDDAAKNS
jgi:hypothetical protein